MSQRLCFSLGAAVLKYCSIELLHPSSFDDTHTLMGKRKLKGGGLMAVWLIRAMAQADEDFKIFFKDGIHDVVAVGWSDINFSTNPNTEALAQSVEKTYYADGATAPQVVGKKVNEVKRFKEMQEKDTVVIPYYNQIRLGIIGKEEIYDDGLAKNRDLSNQRRVTYLRNTDGYVSIPRVNLSEGLQRRLRVRGTTIADLTEFEDEIQRLFTKPTITWLSHFAEKEGDYTAQWQQRLLQNIMRGKTNLQAGGRGLEELVCHLLHLERYIGKVLPKQKFKGYADADIQATKSDLFNTTTLYVQVKHHEGESDAWGAEQLALIRKEQEHDPDIAEAKMVLVTTANASATLKAVAERENIQLITGTELGKWIYDQLGQIGDEWRARLGIAKTGELIF
jgi:restriction system protein